MADSNMRPLKRSRKKPRPGDVFVVSYPVGYLFGRVVATELSQPMPKSCLIYIYNVTSTEPTPDREQLTPDNLLVPPQFTSPAMWHIGLAETIDHWPLEPNDLLPQHCFERVPGGKFVDENGEVIPRRVEPCGLFGLNSRRTLDVEISEALGIALPEKD